jgi:5-methylcytosine-specific restriction endonuclease McrA
MAPVCDKFYGPYDKIQDQNSRVDFLIDVGRDFCSDLAFRCGRHRRFAAFRSLYVMEIADRVIHDRQVASLVSRYLTQLAPGKIKYWSGKKFVNRVKFPEFVKRVLFARDRGKCSHCGLDLSWELMAHAHIDHIIPLANSGCNDILNLQLLCSQCNLKKGSKYYEVKSSIPPYHAQSNANLLKWRKALSPKLSGPAKQKVRRR